MVEFIRFEKKMESVSFRWLLNILLTFVIFYNAELGRLLGLKGQVLAISAVWPSTGFSLAALLLFGFKCWPGIFFGNFFYNVLHLYLGTYNFFGPFLVGTILSLSSLSQALLGGWVIQRFSDSYFETVKDVVIFLIFAGFFPCLLFSSISVPLIYYYGIVSSDLILLNWMTFFIGDSMGIYLLTPLLVVWTLRKPRVNFWRYRCEAVSMVLVFLILYLLVFYWNFPFIHLFLPFCLWVSYRFHFHGATLALFFLCFSAIIVTFIGGGSPFTSIGFSSENYFFYPLLILVTLLQVKVVVSLLVAAMANENEVSSHQLQSCLQNLAKSQKMRQEEYEEIGGEAFLKEKVSALGLIASGMAKQLQVPLVEIDESLKMFRKKLSQLQSSLATTPERFDPLENILKDMTKSKVYASRIAKVIEEQSALAAPSKMQLKTVNVNRLLNLCLTYLSEEEIKCHPEFSFTLVKELDKTISKIPVIPEELAHAFLYFLRYSTRSMREKKEKQGVSYAPMLEIHSEDKGDKIQVTFRDNGEGVSQKKIKIFYTSFISENLPEEIASFHLTLAHDIIVFVHGGEIKVESREGEFLQIMIFLAKTLPTVSDV